MNKFTLFFINLDSNGLNIHIGIILLLVPPILILLFFLFLNTGFNKIIHEWWHRNDFIEAELKLGNIGSVKIKPNHIVSQIAHEVWVELQTRKAALPFDQDHDVITEIYDSWYQLFKEIRQLLRKIPAEKIKYNEDAKKLVDILEKSLNQGLRPNLTKNQARFRKWYLKETNNDNDSSPQEIQQKYPEYKDLISELKQTNQELIDYTGFIKKIAHGKNSEPLIEKYENQIQDY